MFLKSLFFSKETENWFKQICCCYRTSYRANYQASSWASHRTSNQTNYQTSYFNCNDNSAVHSCFHSSSSSNYFSLHSSSSSSNYLPDSQVLHLTVFACLKKVLIPSFLYIDTLLCVLQLRVSCFHQYAETSCVAVAVHVLLVMMLLR